MAKWLFRHELSGGIERPHRHRYAVPMLIWLLAFLGLGVGALDLAGIVHLPHGLGMAAIALGVVLIVLALKIITFLFRIIIGAVVLALAAVAVFGEGVIHHLF